MADNPYGFTLALWQNSDLKYRVLNINTDGYIGIGTETPSTPLDIDLSTGGVLLNLTNQKSNAGTAIGLNSDIEKNYQWRLTSRTPISDLPNGFTIELFKDQSTLHRYFNITSEGYVGIDTETPTEKLEVNGNVLIKENNGLILTSPNGSKFKITVDDDGNLITNKVIANDTIQSVNTENISVKSSILIYPNPSSETITVELDNEDAQDVFLEIYNLSGTLLFLKNYHANLFSCDASSFSSGAYIVKLKNNKGTVLKTEKVIKE